MAKKVKQKISRKAFEEKNYDNMDFDNFMNDRDIRDNIIDVPSKLNTFIANEKEGINAFYMVCTNIKKLAGNKQDTEKDDFIKDVVKLQDTAEIYQTIQSKAYVYCSDTAAGYGVKKKKK